MAYLNANVYKNGIGTSGGGTSGELLEKNCFVALIPDEVTSSTIKGSEICAVSELRNGLGTNADSTELTEVPTSVTNNIANWDDDNSKILNINNISYSRTKALKENEVSYFAICKNSPNTSKPMGAYTNGSNKEVLFLAPDIDDEQDYEVVISGALSSAATLNTASNFMFSGATITFTETDSE